MPARYDRRRATVVAFDVSGWEPPEAVVLDSQCVEVDEVADAVPDLMRAYGLQSYDAVHAATLLASGVTDMVTRDAGFAVLLPGDATLHTTRRRLSRTRARRRDAGDG
jgi:predicted nucleic acid-binding protein